MTDDTPPARPTRVVVVDDQRLVRSSFAMMLSVEDDIDVVGDAATVPRPWSWYDAFGPTWC